MRILIRTSKWAVLARRLGSVAVPLVIIPVVMHRQGLMDSAVFLVVILFAGVVSALAVLSGIIALARLWETGDLGWGRAFSGLFLGLLCLVPFGWYGNLVARHPLVTDIATTDRGELPLIFDNATLALPPPHLLTAAQMRDFFPEIVTRHYPLDVTETFALLDSLVQAQGWDVRRRVEPAEAGETGRVNARIVTLPGWLEEVVLRVSAEGAGTRVDMRSASLGAPHDFGSNGARIVEFLGALDASVAAFLRAAPGFAPPPDPEDEEVHSVQTGEGG